MPVGSRSQAVLARAIVDTLWHAPRRFEGIGKSVHSPEQAAFCALMIEARKKARLTQHDLAKRLKRPQSFIAKYEGGERRIDVVEFLAITKAIGADHVKILRALQHPQP